MCYNEYVCSSILERYEGGYMGIKLLNNVFREFKIRKF